MMNRETVEYELTINGELRKFKTTTITGMASYTEEVGVDDTIFVRTRRGRIVMASAGPETDNRKVTIVRVVSGIKDIRKKETEVLEWDKDPIRFIFNPRLHNTALMKDQEVDGALMSHHTYFNSQLNQYRRSITWGLCNILEMGYPRAKKYVDMGVKEFKKNIKAKYGVDLDAKISDEMAKNDAAIIAKEASRAFYQGQG